MTSTSFQYDKITTDNKNYPCGRCRIMLPHVTAHNLKLSILFTMALVTYLILLGLVKLSYPECVNSNTPRYIIWEKQLRKDLKSNYHYDAPQPACGPLTVDVKFVMKYFTFSSDQEVLSQQVWMHVSWTDERLKWDPAKYGGINKTEISSSSIWTPTFLLQNSADSEDFGRYFFVRCSLESSGAVVCVPRILQNTRCSVNLTDFPYDKQECTVQYGPWEYTKFNMNVSSKAISMWGAAYGSQWVITDYRQQLNNSSRVQLNMTFILEREAQSLASVIVYPSLIISGLTIACLFLDVRSNVRLGLVCFSIFCHYFWLTELAANIPKETAFPPRILLYYRGTTIITALLLPFTFLLAVACKKVTEPHNIVTSINELMYQSYARYFIYLRSETDSTVLIEENKYNEDWTKFANIVNSLCALVVAITYIGLYTAFMPQPIPLNVDD